jgi:tripartite-type tricarboxylate transporter receptor subunit TctC
MNKLRQSIVLAAVALGALQGVQAAPDFPAKAITLVVPYAPGGNTDQVGRMVAATMSKELGQAVVVQNKPGANATLGNAFVAKSAPDGYTLLVGNTSLVLNPLLYKSLPYQEADLEPIAIVVQFPLVLVINNTVPANNLGEFVNYARQQKGKLNFASTGLGNSTHLAGELFKIQSGIEMTHVPYNGSTLALTAVAAGDVQAFFDTTISVLPLIQGGKLKVLAVASTARLPVLPSVPTVAESGFPGYGAVSGWQGVFVPAKTPPEVRSKLRSAIGAAMADPHNRQWIDKQGGVLLPIDMTGANAQKYVSLERLRWQTLIQSQGIKLEN